MCQRVILRCRRCLNTQPGKEKEKKKQKEEEKEKKKEEEKKRQI